MKTVKLVYSIMLPLLGIIITIMSLSMGLTMYPIWILDGLIVGIALILSLYK
jgi:hypothetical protein